MFLGPQIQLLACLSSCLDYAPNTGGKVWIPSNCHPPGPMPIIIIDYTKVDRPVFPSTQPHTGLSIFFLHHSPLCSHNPLFCLIKEELTSVTKWSQGWEMSHTGQFGGGLASSRIPVGVPLLFEPQAEQSSRRCSALCLQ